MNKTDTIETKKKINNTDSAINSIIKKAAKKEAKKLFQEHKKQERIKKRENAEKRKLALQIGLSVLRFMKKNKITDNPMVFVQKKMKG